MIGKFELMSAGYRDLTQWVGTGKISEQQAFDEVTRRIEKRIAENDVIYATAIDFYNRIALKLGEPLVRDKYPRHTGLMKHGGRLEDAKPIIALKDSTNLEQLVEQIIATGHDPSDVIAALAQRIVSTSTSTQGATT